MEYKELGLPGVWMGKSRIFQDNRGSFQEWFLREEFNSISGIDFEIAQSNTSKSPLMGKRNGSHVLAARYLMLL